MQSLQVVGLEMVQRALYMIKMKMNTIKAIALKKFGERIAQVAKENCHVDTGALQESIYPNLLKISINEAILEVVAGSEDVVRGEGRFKVSSKTGEQVTPTPTAEYAEKHETLVGFMETAYQWANSNINNELEIAIRQAIEGF